MNIFQIVGQPGAGKTTLAVEIIRELIRRGFRVGSIKHSAHAHELDKKGKDSYQHRMAGAVPVTMVTRDMAAIYLPRSTGTTMETLLEQYYSGLDFVLIEGWISGPYPKIEVMRPDISRVPLFGDIGGVKAVVSDERLPDDLHQQVLSKGLTRLMRNDVPAVADFITAR